MQVTLDAPRSPSPCRFAFWVAGCKNQSSRGFPNRPKKKCFWANGFTPEWPRSAAESEKLDARITQVLANELTPDAAVQSPSSTTVGSGPPLRRSASPGRPASGQLAHQPPVLRKLPFSRSAAQQRTLSSHSRGHHGPAAAPAPQTGRWLQLEQTRARVSHEILQVVAEVKEAYYSVQAQQQTHPTPQAIVEVNEAGVDLAMRQHKAGNINDLDLANQQATFQQAKLEWGKTAHSSALTASGSNRRARPLGANTQWEGGLRTSPIPSSEPSLEKLEDHSHRTTFDLPPPGSKPTCVGELLICEHTQNIYRPRLISGWIPSARPTGSASRVRSWIWSCRFSDQGQAAIAKWEPVPPGPMEARSDRHGYSVAGSSGSRDMLAARDPRGIFTRRFYLPQRIRIVNETVLQYDAMQKGTFDLIAAKERELSAERDLRPGLAGTIACPRRFEKAIGGRLEGIVDAQRQPPSRKATSR